MKPAPAPWPRITSALYYEDGLQAIEWLCAAFGFEVLIKVVEEGQLMHSELTFGDGLLMVGNAGKDAHRRSPRSVGGGNTQALFIYVDDVEAHCARARAAGAVIAKEPSVQDYGADYWADRSYEAVDPEGHRFWFAQRLRSAPS